MKPQKDAEARIKPLEGEVAAAKKAADTAKAEALVQIKEAEDKIKALEGKVFVATEAAAKAEQARRKPKPNSRRQKRNWPPRRPPRQNPHRSSGFHEGGPWSAATVSLAPRRPWSRPCRTIIFRVGSWAALR